MNSTAFLTAPWRNTQQWSLSGLEERVLANLQAERKKAPSRVWWHWGLSAVVAAVLLPPFRFVEIRDDERSVGRGPPSGTGFKFADTGTRNGATRREFRNSTKI